MREREREREREKSKQGRGAVARKIVRSYKLGLDLGYIERNLVRDCISTYSCSVAEFEQTNIYRDLRLASLAYQPGLQNRMYTLILPLATVFQLGILISPMCVKIVHSNIQLFCWYACLISLSCFACKLKRFHLFEL